MEVSRQQEANISLRMFAWNKKLKKDGGSVDFNMVKPIRISIAFQHIHTLTRSYIYIYIYVFVCVGMWGNFIIFQRSQLFLIISHLHH